MPAEYAPHAGCWMLWPERPDNWRSGALPAQAAFAEVAAAIARFEPVTVGVSATHYEFARAQLAPHVRVLEISHDDSWMRDVGPTFVTNSKGVRRGVDWRFNAWGGLEGGLYFPWDQDDLVARKVLEFEGCDRYRAPFINEGGAIHVDGAGTALVTEQCLLNPNRNPELSQVEIEELLRAYLGVRTVIWLGEGVIDDETDGHIDNLACFVKPGVVALTWTDDTDDPQHAVSADALERLEAARDARKRNITVIKLPMPGPLERSAARGGRRAGARSHARAHRRRAPGRQLRQFLHRKQGHRHAVAGRAHRSRCRSAAQTRLSGPQDRGRARARDPVRRRQHSLHHPAGTPMRQPK